MRVLIDTNILIRLEDAVVLQESYAQLMRLLDDSKSDVFIHPASLADVERDSNEDRKQITLSKLKRYKLFENPPDCTGDFESRGINCKNENDQVDCQLLCAVFRDAVHFLITEDKGIHSKAKRLNIGDRVLYVQQALQSLKVSFGLIPISLPNILQSELCNLRHFLETPFFDPIRGDYPGFDEWFVKQSRDGRNAWYSQDDSGKLGSICIFKVEDPEILTDDRQILPSKSLKLCTFRVGETVRGRKIGELLLKAAFHFARSNSLEYIYVTVIEGKQTHLEELLVDFGFSILGKKEHELVYLKKHPANPPQRLGPSALDYHRVYWPHMYGGRDIRKFIVPIRPPYHR